MTPLAFYLLAPVIAVGIVVICLLALVGISPLMAAAVVGGWVGKRWPE